MSYSIHADTKLGELKLKVRDLARSVRFYSDIIGFKVLKQEGNVALMTVDGENVFLALEQLPDAVLVPERSATGLYHFAILVPTREQLGISLRKLAESNIRIGQGDHLVSEALYLSDPDQNGIEIYRDRPRSEWTKDEAGNIVMGTEAVDIQGLLALAGDKPWTGLPADTVLGHIHLHVDHLATAKAFYCDVLGFDIVADMSRRMGAYFISAGGYHHHIGMNIWAGAGAPRPPENGTGLDYYTIVLPSAEQLRITLDRLGKVGIPAAEHQGYWLVQDPAGISVRLSAAS
ncbi:VOC family protein [Cohnella suwonensis]|uniref:VOC family protein n=1 Tax=Cohnella suwonensis TaxID=696072 RepID=A0ABW0LXY0_9BACL